MGQDGHNHGSRVIASGFSDMKFDVDVGALFSTPGEVAHLDADSYVHVIGVLSQVAGYLYLFPALRDKFRMRKRWRRTRGARKKREDKRRTEIWWWWRGGSYQPGITIFSWEEGRTTLAKRAGAAMLYITAAAVDVLGLIHGNRGGGRR